MIYGLRENDLRQVKYYTAFVKTDLRQVKCYMAFVQTDLRQVNCYMAFVETDLQNNKRRRWWCEHRRPGKQKLERTTRQRRILEPARPRPVVASPGGDQWW